ncbi:hypothetical protein F4780DRAFT_233434 [Xylariomycetidae sp. FL0641]|nr:hypothetical protein F4780DRAFT_233434 [Xylariomycetidae sp. FL0641]
MPPKRAAQEDGAAANKKAKTASDDESEMPAPSKRWSAVSGSANADSDYRTTWTKPEKWYSYITFCGPPGVSSDDEDEDEDEEDEDEDDEIREGCGKKDCVCQKPSSDNPDHPWHVSKAGYRKFNTQFIFHQLRDPDNFDMYTFNDHSAYGALETLENLVLDFNEAAERGWKEQWAVCEGLALWLTSDGYTFTRIDDGDRANDMMRLIGHMFLYMLAQLDRQNLVGDGTEVKSLGCFMALYIHIIEDMRRYGILELEEAEEEDTKKFDPVRPDDAILSYANKRGVTLRGPHNIDKLVANLDGEVELPEAQAKDPWGFQAAFKEYEGKQGTAEISGRPASIGGDALDITTWTSAERKAQSFTKKDPLGKKEIKAIKNGLVMCLG